MDIEIRSAPPQRWAARGKETDSCSDIEIRMNPQHFQIWTWEQCHYEDGTPKFNLDFLGRWRNGHAPIDWRNVS